MRWTLSSIYFPLNHHQRLQTFLLYTGTLKRIICIATTGLSAKIAIPHVRSVILSIITKEELELLTGYTRSKDIAECLNKHRIYFVEGKGNHIATTDNWLNQAGVDRQSINDDGFNLEF